MKLIITDNGLVVATQNRPPTKHTLAILVSRENQAELERWRLELAHEEMD